MILLKRAFSCLYPLFMLSLKQQLVCVCTLSPMLLLKGELEHVFSYYTMILLKKVAGTFCTLFIMTL